MSRSIAVLALLTLGVFPACKNSKVTTAATGKWAVTASVDAGLTVSPTGAQEVADGATQTFTLAAVSGYTLSQTVGGTCAAGTWSGDAYSTGPVTADCTVSFVSSVSNTEGGGGGGGGTQPDLTTYTAVVSGGNLTVSATTLTASSGGNVSVTVTANAGFGLLSTVGGTCPAGTWHSGVYTTGPLSANCTLIFAAGVLAEVDVHVSGGVTAVQTGQALVGAAADFNLNIPYGKFVQYTYGSCPAGAVNGNTYTSGVLQGNCTLYIYGATISPNVINPLLRTTGVAFAGGNATFNFAWDAASDSITAAANQNYTLCAIGTGPGSVTSQPDGILGGLACVNMIGTTTGSVTVPSGDIYAFNVVAANTVGGMTGYRPKVEFADPTLQLYMPFDGNGNDIVGGLHAVAASWQSVNANTPSWSTDRHGNPNSSTTYAQAQQECLSTNANITTSVTGNLARTITFWAKSGNNLLSNHASLAYMGGTTNQANNDAFGLSNGTDANYVLNFGGSVVETNVPFANNGGWTHWAISWTPSGSLASVSTDGIRVATQATTNGTVSTGSGPLFIGCGLNSVAALAGFFDGQIDEVRVFSRVLCDDNYGGGNYCNGNAGELAVYFNMAQ